MEQAETLAEAAKAAEAASVAASLAAAAAVEAEAAVAAAAEGAAAAAAKVEEEGEDEGKRKEPAQSPPPPPPPPLPPPCVFPPGIINGGAAVCYFNAALQALASAEPLVDFLGAYAAAAAAAVSPSSSASSASSSASSASSPSSSASSDLLMEASALLSALSPNLWKGESNECGRNSTSPPLSSAPLLAALRAASPAAESSLRPNRQQDSVEAAQLLLEAVSVAAAANATGRGGGSGEGQGRGAAAAVAATASREGRDRGLAAFCSPSSLPPLSRWASSSPSAHSASVNPCAGTVISESACVKCRSARPSEVTPFTVLPLPLPPLRRRDSSPSSPPSSRGFVSSLEAALLSFTGTEPLMSGLECGRCTLVRVIREAQGEAAEAEATGRPPPRWRQQNMSDGGGGGDATRNEFLELLQLAFGERSPFPVDVEVQAERARRVGLPWDRTVSRAAAAAAAGAGAGAVGAAAAEAAAAAAENASSPSPSPSTSTRPSAPPPPPLPRETAVRRATLARCPRVLCLQLLRALGPGDKLRGGVYFGLVVDVARFTAAGAGPLLPSWRAREEKEERKREEEEEEEEEAERRRRRRPRVSGAEAETSGAAPLRRFIVPLSEPPGPRQLLPPEKAQGPIYLLSAVVAHTGSGTSRGHYICYRRFRGPSPPSSPSSSPPGGGDGDSGDASPSPCAPSPSPSSPPSSTYWCGCSDLRVWRASDEEVRGCEAVMLVYCRQ